MLKVGQRWKFSFENAGYEIERILSLPEDEVGVIIEHSTCKSFPVGEERVCSITEYHQDIANPANHAELLPDFNDYIKAL